MKERTALIICSSLGDVLDAVVRDYATDDCVSCVLLAKKNQGLAARFPSARLIEIDCSGPWDQKSLDAATWSEIRACRPAEVILLYREKPGGAGYENVEDLAVAVAAEISSAMIIGVGGDLHRRRFAPAFFSRRRAFRKIPVFAGLLFLNAIFPLIALYFRWAGRREERRAARIGRNGAAS